MTLAFDLVGGWTSARLLVRVLALGEPDWEPLRAGFTRRSTGERATIAMGGHSPALAASFAAEQPFRPPLDEALLDEIAGHRAVVAVSDPRPVTAPLEAAATLVRAASAVVNAGALAVRCRTSGVRRETLEVRWEGPRFTRLDVKGWASKSFDGGRPLRARTRCR